MNDRRRKLRETGITLVALVVTIIVLLILAGVTITLALNNNGVMERAQYASNTWANATVGEEEMMGDFSSEIDRLGLSNVNSGSTVDFAAIMAEAKGNRVEYEEIGIGTDGSILDLDKWIYDLSNNEISLGNYFSSESYSIGYNGSIVNGEIEGTIPQYIMPEGEDEFYPVTSLNATFMDNTELVKAPEIPSTVTNLNYTFYNCTSLTTVGRIPESVRVMNRTFGFCSLVNAPIIPNGVTEMEYTFCYCTALTTVPDIPDSVTYMSGTFEGCSSLVTAPKLSSNVERLDTVFNGCSSLKVVQIPEGVTSLSSTFSNCTGLETAPVIPESVESLSFTFNYCTSLTSAPRIPEAVNDLYHTFSNCSKLTGDIVIDGNVLNSNYYYSYCFKNAATDEGCDLKITGNASSETKNLLLSTKSSNSHISIKE